MNSAATSYRPAQGYEPMTTYQADQFFELLRQLCQPQSYGKLTIVVEDGKPLKIESTVSKKFRPVPT